METETITGIILSLFVLAMITLGSCAFVDTVYFYPVASDVAQNYCVEKGYDTYDDFKRVGIFSKEPVAIRCKYVEQYKNVDLNINKNTDEGILN